MKRDAMVTYSKVQSRPDEDPPRYAMELKAAYSMDGDEHLPSFTVNIESQVPLDLLDGEVVEMEIPFAGFPEPEPCFHCHGRGWQSIEGTYSYAIRAARNEPHSRRLCEPCGGDGVLRAQVSSDTCPACGGSGDGYGYPCARCLGSGKVES